MALFNIMFYTPNLSWAGKEEEGLVKTAYWAVCINDAMEQKSHSDAFSSVEKSPRMDFGSQGGWKCTSAFPFRKRTQRKGRALCVCRQESSILKSWDISKMWIPYVMKTFSENTLQIFYQVSNKTRLAPLETFPWSHVQRGAQGAGVAARSDQVLSTTVGMFASGSWQSCHPEPQTPFN